MTLKNSIFPAFLKTKKQLEKMHPSAFEVRSELEVSSEQLDSISH